MVIRESARPKINLFLDVLGKRPDGCHDIRSVFLPLRSPVDSVRLQATRGAAPRLVCTAQEVPADGSNLCLRALEAFAEVAGTPRGWRIDLVKRIPVAAGLGGGSSDAAAVLRALNRAYDGILSPDELHRVASSLGADVPFFLDSVPALGEGVGDRLKPIDCEAQLGVVLACPGFPVSARWAYDHWCGRAQASPNCTALLHALAEGDAEAVSGLLYNALEPAVLQKFPLVTMIAEAMLSAGCRSALVSGSGPTVFGLCEMTRTAAVARALRDRFDNALTVVESASARGNRPTQR